MQVRIRGGVAAAVCAAAIACHAHGAPAPGARTVQSLDAGWRFARAQAGADAAAQPPAAVTASWTPVTLPHTFNADDGTTPGFYRGAAWYVRDVPLSRAAKGRTYLEFDGAALSTDVWINGVHVGRHEGGFARFRFDVTDHLHPGDNRLAVRVDNARHPDVAPLGGDYTLYGGLYRSVRLVRTDDVHFDMLDHGASGVYFDASEVAAGSARLHWTARVANDGAGPLRATVTARLRDRDGHVVATVSQPVQVAPHAVLPVALDARIAAPHLWQGTLDPYLYASDVAIEKRAARPAVLDRMRYDVGLRDLRFDPDKGLLLNGRPTSVHGVNVHHTYVPGKGVAASDGDVDADYQILKELGVTGLRFAHYQHGQHSYDLADRNGYLVWTELPLNAEVGTGEAFERNLAQQARELVRQNRHHPSVFVWGLGNELYKVDAASAHVLDAMQRLVHEEDASRPTVYANCCAPLDGPQASHTDVVGSNVYFGWYDNQFADLAPWLAANHALRPTTPQAVSEYGAGASIRQQEDPPRRPKPAGDWHPEQYQTLYHEAAWPQLAAARWLWGSFVWAGFDFPSAGRHEGDTPGINDKGLVSLDRRVRKDAYYWYQANWSARPMVYIASRRNVVHDTPDVEVKVYTNAASVTLRLNGADLGTRPAVGHIVRWQARLAPGDNVVEAVTPAGSDRVEWRLAPATPGADRTPPAALQSPRTPPATADNG